MHEREAVVFDLDGTLTDTETIWDRVRSGLAVTDGVPWPDDATQKMIGMSTQEWSAYLADVVGIRGDVRRRTLDAVLAAYREHLPVLPGAVEALHRLAARWPLGLATSSSRVLIDASLDIMGVTDLFEITLTTEELGGVGKPAPDVYLEACRRLGVEPAHAVAVEDSPNGLVSAHDAGMRVVAIPPAFHPPTATQLAVADVVVASLDDLTVDLVERLLGRA